MAGIGKGNAFGSFHVFIDLLEIAGFVSDGMLEDIGYFLVTFVGDCEFIERIFLSFVGDCVFIERIFLLGMFGVGGFISDFVNDFGLKGGQTFYFIICFSGLRSSCHSHAFFVRLFLGWIREIKWNIVGCDVICEGFIYKDTCIGGYFAIEEGRFGLYFRLFGDFIGELFG